MLYRDCRDKRWELQDIFPPNHAYTFSKGWVYWETGFMGAFCRMAFASYEEDDVADCLQKHLHLRVEIQPVFP